MFHGIYISAENIHSIRPIMGPNKTQKMHFTAYSLKLLFIVTGPIT